jgi:type I restriction enzyme R subunit
MRPVVVDPDITLEQLFGEFARLDDEKHRDVVREQILLKMRRRIKRLHEQARARYEAEAGETPEATLKRLTAEPPATMAAWMKERPGLGTILDWKR